MMGIPARAASRAPNLAFGRLQPRDPLRAEEVTL